MPITQQRYTKRKKQTNSIRIIGGQWRGKRLPTLNLEILRPTPDRVRETLFNWLGQSLYQWRCVDAFAGSGVLGFEAASRGASEVFFIEHDINLIRQLHLTQEQLMGNREHTSHAKFNILQGDTISLLKTFDIKPIDLLILDPPYGQVKLRENALRQVQRLLASKAYVYLESNMAYDESYFSPFGLSLHRHLRAGHCHAHLLVNTV
jgi:16S rRNA (guanine(966)-N(2))-methyltransferase RsmD